MIGADEARELSRRGAPDDIKQLLRRTEDLVRAACNRGEYSVTVLDDDMPALPFVGRADIIDRYREALAAMGYRCRLAVQLPDCVPWRVELDWSRGEGAP